MHKLLISITVAATLTGCSGMGKVTSTFSSAGDVVTDQLANWSLLYRADVQQGNVVTQEMVDTLRPGMTQNQVRYVLGTPLVTDSFNNNRWDYIYRNQSGETGVITQKRLTVLFDANGNLSGIAGDYRPGGAQQ